MPLSSVAPRATASPHWNNASEDVITAFTAWVCLRTRPQHSNLGSVADLISDEESYKGTLVLMQESDACGGVLRRMGHQLARLRGDELNSVLSSTFEHLSFLNSPLIKAHTACPPEDSFDPHALVRGDPVTLFVGLPADQLRPLSRLLRLQLTGILRAFMRAGPNRCRRPCLVFLDEVSQLGPMLILQDALTLLRGYGVKLWFFLQSTGQISEIFPGDKAQTFRSNIDVTQFLGPPNDYPTAEEISKRCGDATIPVLTENGGEGWSVSTAGGTFEGQHTTYGSSGNTGWSVQETGRALLKPEEALRLPSDQQIIFCKNLPPIRAQVVRSYADPEFRNARGPDRAGAAWSILAWAALLALAVWIVLGSARRHAASR